MHRRSNLYEILEGEPSHSLIKERSWKYPLHEFGGIYTKNCVVFRGSEMQGYPFLQEAQTLDIITVAAYARPPLVMNSSNGELEMKKEVLENTKRKIKAMLNMCLDNQCVDVVLSAFGCGAFSNNPRQIATLFKEVIASDFANKFRSIYFAIIDDHNARRLHNPNGNVKPFQVIFG